MTDWINLENGFSRYKVAHKEVMNQLMLEVEETLGGEDAEMTRAAAKAESDLAINHFCLLLC